MNLRAIEQLLLVSPELLRAVLAVTLLVASRFLGGRYLVDLSPRYLHEPACPPRAVR